MSKRQWLVLLMLFLTYLLLGAFIFYHIESRLEIERVKNAKQERIEINALLREHYVTSRSHDYEEILGKLTQYCGKSVYNYTEGEADPLRWDFYNSFYFAYTVVSTIGYGNLAPTNTLSRILMIFYGLVGIPMNGILLTQLGEFFGNAFIRAHRKYKSYKRGQSEYCPKKAKSLERRKVGLAAQIFAYLTPGFVMFIFFPAFVFSHYEGWSYDEAVYYAFVTLTTIGFGDYVAGQDNSKGNGFFFVLYKTFLICWISFGLGYIVMIMTFIARGMRSKKITRIEHKLAINLKHTQSKIWNEFNKEINYLRRVFNELQLSKVKRVYVDECEYETPPAKFSRSNSFPDLRELLYGRTDVGRNDTPEGARRRRANSEIVPREDQMTRVVSETDLQRIDKTATFASHAIVQPAELLARLVNILGYIPPTSDDLCDPTGNWEREVGQQHAEDSETTRRVADEEATRSVRSEASRRATGFYSNESSWILGSERILPISRPRSRAASEIRLREASAATEMTTTTSAHSGENDNRLNAEWTWSGPAASRKIRELMRARAVDSVAQEVKPSKFRTFGLTRSVPRTLLPRLRKQFAGKKSSELESAGILSFLAGKGLERVGKGDKGDSEKRDIPSRDSDARDSISTGAYYTHTGAGNASVANEGSNLLEETSLADFLRALTVLHATVGTMPEDYAIGKPRRKMGTASLTPPKLPSLFTLFSSAPAGDSNGGTVSAVRSDQNTLTRRPSAADRRFSLGLPEIKSSGSSTPFRTRRGSVAFAPRSGRFSLRPVATPVSPPTPPPARHASVNVTAGPPFSVTGDDQSSARSVGLPDTFLFESPKEPLIRMEREPGISSPIKPTTNSRRSSLRPIQGNPTSTGQPGLTPGTKPTLPRWKAGMLQRHISQMQLRRRVRAFSLSDVYADDNATRATSAAHTELTPNSSQPPPSQPPRKSVTVLSSRGQDIVGNTKSNNSSVLSSPLSSRTCVDVVAISGERHVSSFSSSTERIDNAHLPISVTNEQGKEAHAHSVGSRFSVRQPSAPQIYENDQTPVKQESTTTTTTTNLDTHWPLFEVKVEQPVAHQSHSYRNDFTERNIEDTKSSSREEELRAPDPKS